MLTSSLFLSSYCFWAPPLTFTTAPRLPSFLSRILSSFPRSHKPFLRPRHLSSYARLLPPLFSLLFFFSYRLQWWWWRWCWLMPSRLLAKYNSAFFIAFVATGFSSCSGCTAGSYSNATGAKANAHTLHGWLAAAFWHVWFLRGTMFTARPQSWCGASENTGWSAQPNVAAVRCPIVIVSFSLFEIMAMMAIRSTLIKESTS